MRHGRCPREGVAIRLHLEPLEERRLLAADFGDAPAPYPTLLLEDGAQHTDTGPTLGPTRDYDADGTHSANADADGADEDGVTFGTIQVGALGATATVNVQGGAAKLDAWIDFNGDGNWGSPGEQIFNNLSVTVGNNVLSFDVPSWAVDGVTYARFRLSTAGNLGTEGAATDGEVEDYAVTILPPAASSREFGGQTVISASADGAQSVFAADVDGDGDMDVLSASLLDDKIAWYENDGSQNFTAHTIITAADGGQSVFAADMDGDGDTDVLSASYNDDKIAWYENDGSQNFTAHTISTAANGAVSVFAADVDGDGDMDVLSASLLDDKIAWYENDGSQNFTAHTITTAADRAWSVFAADVDGDGDMDVLSASYFDDKIAWYENDGSQNFTAHTISTAANSAVSVFAADVDSDGDMDVLSASDDKIAWYENDGSQNFTPQTITTAANGGWSVFAADVDGDGDMDVLSASYFDSKIAWYENDGSQYFTPRTITNSAAGVRGVFAADMDGDGDTDVLSASIYDNKIAWYENDGSQTFIAHTISTTANSAHSVFAADVDGDGDTDVLSASVFDDKIAWYENDGSQNFTAHTITTTADGARSVFAADVDGDGDTDVLSASANDNKIAWYENDGSQNFTAHTISTAANGAFSVFAADVDGDGDTDVLSASPHDDKIAWYENDGNQNFTAHTISTAADWAASVFAADLDGDGDTDVLSASVLDDKIAWYEQLDELPSLALSPATLIEGEGDSGTTSYVFTVTLSQAINETVNVAYDSADGSATTADNDYAAANGTLTFAPGQTSQLVTVLVNGDTTNEADEDFTLLLSDANNATLAAASAQGVIQNDDADSSVVARRIFYNQSAFDGNSAAINAADDGAIAPDKTAYLPGDGLAVFDNITGYSRGINGIMVDLAPAGGSHTSITANDFVFKVGANNSPNTWAAAPASSAISVRTGAGVSGSDRVEITWANGAIQNQWLEVQVLATANTGLAAPDIFFFGNRIGDTGAPTASSFTTVIADASTIVAGGLGGAGGITNVRDIDKSNTITVAGDRATALGNIGALNRLNVGTAGPFAPQDGDAGIASALAAAVAPAPAPVAALPPGIVRRIQRGDLNASRIAAYFRQLAESDAERFGKLGAPADLIDNTLELDEELVGSLAAGL
ncbi:MAG: FG-GAP-like repeat-containing protein [Pirellulales bacterium]